MLRCFASFLRSSSCGLRILVLSSLRRQSQSCWRAKNLYFSFHLFHLFHLEVQLRQLCVTRGPRGAVLGWTGSPRPLVLARDPGTGHMCPRHQGRGGRRSRETFEVPENLRMSVFRGVSKDSLNSEDIQNNSHNIQSYSRIYTLRHWYRLIHIRHRIASLCHLQPSANLQRPGQNFCWELGGGWQVPDLKLCRFLSEQSCVDKAWQSWFTKLIRLSLFRKLLIRDFDYL